MHTAHLLLQVLRLGLALISHKLQVVQLLLQPRCVSARAVSLSTHHLQLLA